MTRRWGVGWCWIVLVAGGAWAQEAPASREVQIASSVLALPAEYREGAAVLGYDEKGRVVELRAGQNEMICLADRPGDRAFSAACYHRELEPYMARGRELEAQGIKGPDRNEGYRWKEIREGRLKMPAAPRMLYVLSGKSYDETSRSVVDGVVRWVIYVPGATTESLGLSSKPKRGEPWLMDAGTPGAHIMITPK
ncbi:MAG: hypothetical protein ACO394_05930 [Blastocatellia bacterium]